MKGYTIVYQLALFAPYLTPYSPTIILICSSVTITIPLFLFVISLFSLSPYRGSALSLPYLCLSGTFGVMWYVFWIMVSYESPAAHPTITPEERQYIEDAIGESAGLANPLSVRHSKNLTQHDLTQHHLMLFFFKDILTFLK